MAFCGNSTFMDWRETVYSSWPRLSRCFQETALVYVPATFLLLSLLVYVPYLLTLPRASRPVDSPLSIAKTVLSIILASVAMAAMITDVFSKPPSRLHSQKDAEEFFELTASRYVAKSVEVVSYITTAFLVQMEKQRSVMTSGVLFIYWLLLTICNIPAVLTFIEIKMYAMDLPKFLILSASVFLTCTELILNCFTDLRLVSKRYRPEENSPDLTASFLSRLIFFWMSRLLYTGYKRPLRPSDLWKLKNTDCCKKVLSRFEQAHGDSVENERDSNRIFNFSMMNNNNSLRFPRKKMDDLVNSHNSSLFTDNEKMPLLGSSKPANDYNSKPEKTIHKFYLEKESPHKKTDGLFKILFKAFGKEVFLSYFCKFVSDTLQFASPFLLKELIIYVSVDGDNPESVDERQPWHPYLVVLAMMMTSWLQTVFYHQHFHLAMTSGMRMRTALMGAIYKKSLCLSNTGRQARSSGEVINLMSVDAQRVQEMMSYTWMVWSIPYQMFLAVFFLWNTMGVPVLAGVLLIMLLIPFNALLAYHQQRLQRVNLLWKDTRIKLLGEILAGIKVLKLYSWEDVFCDKVKAIRKKEVKVLIKLAWLSAGSTFIWTCAPYLVSLVSFGTFILMSPTSILTAEIAFITVALFNILQFPVAFVPECVNCTSQAFVALRRINAFLKENEFSKKDGNNSIQYSLGGDRVAVCIDKGLFAWDESDYFRLHCAKIYIARGSFTAVVGAVGSGKTSLLSSLMGEMKTLQGNVTLRGTTAYVPQSAWIQNATVQQNVLFGHSVRRRKYKNVLRACTLDADLKALPGGDMTEIGDKGVNMSGGQRQRVGLARALYSDADVYILDDPLSAVDSTVGKQIFKRSLCSKGYLKDKTRIMATHAIQWLPLVDYIIYMQGGRVAETGTYLELTKREGQFFQFLKKEVTKESDEELSSQDEEVRNMKRTMKNHVEAISSSSGSASATSSDEIKRIMKTDDMGPLRMTPNGNSSPHIVPGRPESTTSRDQQPSPYRSMNSRPTSALSTKSTKTPTTNLLFNTTSNPATPAPRLDIARLVEEESLNDGNVSLGVYGQYWQNIGYCCTCLIFGLFLAYQGSSVLANLYLAKWTGDKYFFANTTSTTEIRKGNWHYLEVYGSLGALQVFFICIYAFLVAIRMVRASARLHSAMLTRIIKAPMSFFDTTPAGRILNRFSRDVENLDSQLPQVLMMFVMCVFSVTATFVVISIRAHLFITVIVPLFLMYWALQRFFVRTSRQLKRMEAVSRSPIFTHFSETLSGCQVIRAFDRTRSFQTEFNERLDGNNVFYFAAISANRWLGIWIEVISSLVVFATSAFLLVTPGVDGATVGLAVTYALQITQALKWLVRTMSDIETNAVSLERVLEYTQVPQERPHVIDEDAPGYWPEKGEVVFDHVTTSYRPGLKPVLNDVSFRIAAGEKIGIVGRTGAGKSSLTLALFRLIEIDQGVITLDNRNISDTGLRTLRSSIAILPQDPVLISGNLRTNLDPKSEHGDDVIWNALTLVNLRNVVTALPEQLETDVGENGSRFSMGQKQLVCLARALLRPVKVLVMDEPTSSVDSDTDAIVQHTIKRAFRGCTTITIAHRITSILHCDRVMVLEAGRVVEFDKPMELLKVPDSNFTSLARASAASAASSPPTVSTSSRRSIYM